MHYKAYNRYGDPLFRKKRAKGSRWTDEKGYLLYTDNDHPMASPRGTVLEHRAVLYDSIGPGQQHCVDCNAVIEWGSTLIVNHIDENRLNNSIENLEPMCHLCNWLYSAIKRQVERRLLNAWKR